MKRERDIDLILIKIKRTEKPDLVNSFRQTNKRKEKGIICLEKSISFILHPVLAIEVKVVLHLH